MGLNQSQCLGKQKFKNLTKHCAVKILLLKTTKAKITV